MLHHPGYVTSPWVCYISCGTSTKGAPAKLLIGTNLLSQLGYFFIQTTEDSKDCDLLTTESSSSDDLSGIISQKKVQSNEGE